MAVTLSLPSDYLARLIVKARGLQAREAEVDPLPGSNASDDNMLDAVQETRGDLSREELREELEGLHDRAQAELVALMWIGRGMKSQKSGSGWSRWQGRETTSPRLTISLVSPWSLNFGRRELNGLGWR